MTNVLLLEDSDALARSIVGALEADGHSVTWFRNLREARAAIPPIGFQVLLCDYELPDGTGLDFLAEVDSTSGGLGQWTTIIWSGSDRTSEVYSTALAVDHVLLKGVGAPGKILEIVRA